jgi:hypothetical protein
MILSCVTSLELNRLDRDRNRVILFLFVYVYRKSNLLYNRESVLPKDKHLVVSYVCFLCCNQLVLFPKTHVVVHHFLKMQQA